MATAPAGRTGRRRKGEESGRDAVLHAALRQFARLGFDGATLRGITAEAGVDMALAGHMFGSKAGLWTAVIDRMAEHQSRGLPRFEAIRDADRPAAWQMTALIEQFVEVCCAVPEFPAFLLQHAGGPEERRDIFADRALAPFLRIAVPIIEAAIQAGVLRPVHPVLFFFMLTSAIGTPVAAQALVARLAGPPADEFKARIKADAVAAFIGRPG